ncbi:TPA: hypothetical protein ACH3X1_009704 [Trebouxia sp. C0004]
MGVCQFCDCTIASGKVEDLRAHGANCKKATPDAQLAARVQQVKAGGGSGKSSSQMSLNSYADTGKDKLNKEQNKALQRLLTLAFIMCDAMAAKAAAEVEQDACDIRAAPSMDLCSTEEMIQVFNEYYEGDVQDMSRSSINNTNIQASADVSGGV